MKIYKVIKDFPAMRAGTQYRIGETIRLEQNGRTDGLVKLGYIQENIAETREDEDLGKTSDDSTISNPNRGGIV